MKKCVGIWTVLIILTACENVPIWKYDIFKRPPGDGQYSAMFLHGWQDGCQSGAEASANYLYRYKYKFTQDWKLLDDKQYVTGWEQAYNFCRKYIFQNNYKDSN